jgi:hypothetical protein
MIVSEDMMKVVSIYNEGLRLYKTRQFSEARAKFLEALQINPNDTPSQLYVDRCDSFIANPPPEDWDGVYIMTTK